MRGWQKRCLSMMLTAAMLCGTIPVSGATGVWSFGGTDTQVVTFDADRTVAVASGSNAVWEKDAEFTTETKTPITGVVITSKPKNPTVGMAGIKLRRSITPAGAEKFVIAIWTSTDPEVATIDSNGNLVLLKAGTTTINLEVSAKANTDYVGSASDSYELTVLPAEGAVTGVVITGKPQNPVKAGDDLFRLGYDVTPGGAAVTSRWSSTKPAVASIDDRGDVRIAGTGKTTIELEVTGTGDYEGTVTDSFELTVEEANPAIPIGGIEITNQPTVPLKAGGASIKLLRKITPDTKFVNVRWSSSDTAVAAIDEKSGELTPLIAGTTTITVTAKGYGDYTGTVSDSFELIVEEAPPAIPLTGIIMTGQPQTPRHVGDSSFKLRYTTVPEGAAVTAVWTSSNPEIAEVDIYGNVAIIAAGTTTIMLEATGKEGYAGTVTTSYVLEILPERGAAIPITGIIMTGKPTAPSYVGDSSFKLRYNTTPYGADVIPVWTSTNPDAASIDPYGNVTMVGPGKSTIKLEATGKDGYEGRVSDSFVLTVLPASIILDKNEVFLDRGDSVVVTVNMGPESAKLAKQLPIFYQADGVEGESSWPSEYLSTTPVENGEFPDHKLTIKIAENIPDHVAYGEIKMKLLLLRSDAVVEDGQEPEAEDILTEEIITIYFREKKVSVLPPVKPGVPRVDRLRDALDQIHMDQLTLVEKRELAGQVLESLEQQKITVKHTIGNETLAENLMAVEEKLELLLGISPEKSGDSDHLQAVSFTGSLFNVLSGKTPVIMVEDEIIDDDKTAGMGVLPDCEPVALDIKLTADDGTLITKLNVPMRLRVDALALGLNTRNRIVIKHIKSDGTISYLPYVADGSDLLFWVSDYSTFVFANGSTAAEGGTTAPGGNGGGVGGGSVGGGRILPVPAATAGTWKQDAGGWRFIDGTGVPLADTWMELTWNGKADWYHFNTQAYADGGWLQSDNHTYYLNPTHSGQFGVMMTGWQQIDGKWYYFQPQSGGPMGAMLREGTTPDGFKVGADGVRQ